MILYPRDYCRPHMFLFKLCYDSIKNCYSSDNVDAVHERTPLHRGTVVHNPPPQRSGFSGGFVSFFESSRGILFGFTNLAIFYLAAVVAFSFIFEEWTIIDSVYFATVTFTTIGEVGMCALIGPRTVILLIHTPQVTVILLPPLMEDACLPSCSVFTGSSFLDSLPALLEKRLSRLTMLLCRQSKIEQGSVSSVCSV